MQDPGHLIAIDVFLLYTILGPLVLFAIYVLFDSLSKSSTKNAPSQQTLTVATNDPALWTNEEIIAHMSRM